MHQYERTAELANGERTVEDIAEILGISLWATRNSIQRARNAGYPCKVRHMRAKRASVKDVLVRADGTRSVLDIAVELGISARTVEDRLFNLRAAGHFVATKGTIHKYRRGTMNHIITNLPPEVHIWLVEQCPKESYLSDIIRSIVIDAYHDEVTPSPAKRG